ncbi:glycoside hydrolase family 6 protein [Nocardioides ferulae]|uniref:glycoside hydrolase family 6 protein n=1 Tax=Nocardioides ferulae TaxID=2340821 RepID=UPI000EB334EC|nr:glycoside hydrolase family 6 protein [Nocardioides ferulae]
MTLHPLVATLATLVVATVSLTVPAWGGDPEPTGSRPAAVASPIAGPDAGTASGSVQIDTAYLTGYTRFDNLPRGSRAISHPAVHRRAGGTGTYRDPITLAVGHTITGSGDDLRQVLDHRRGIRFYLPQLRRYFVVEDTCGDGLRPQRGPCHDLSTAPDGATTWLRLWVGSGPRARPAAVRACAATITHGDGLALRTAVKRPPRGLPVVPGPLFDRGRCTDLHPPLEPTDPEPTAPEPTTPTDSTTPAPTPSPTPSSSPTPTPTSGPTSPLAGWRFYVDPDTPAARQADDWALNGRPDDAALIEKIARQPRSVWVVDPSSLGPLDRALDAAATRGQAVTTVLYYLPHRDCGAWSSGGAADAAGYRRLVDDLARTIGDRQAVVVVEPDAVALAVGGCAGLPDAGARYALLREAVRTLATLPQTRVYLDAGHPAWHDPSRLVGPLEDSGIADADGFSLNVSNFHTTDATTAFGERLSYRLGGTHFVIDTSRNGRGPLASDPTGPTWCNPAGRALGDPPTTQTGRPLVDAWLWVKPPGESDGSCRPGEPSAGSWWSAYALELARNAA